MSGKDDVTFEARIAALADPACAASVLRELDELREASQHDAGLVALAAIQADNRAHDEAFVVASERDVPTGKNCLPSCMVCAQAKPFKVSSIEHPEHGVCWDCCEAVERLAQLQQERDAADKRAAEYHVDKRLAEGRARMVERERDALLDALKLAQWSSVGTFIGEDYSGTSHCCPECANRPSEGHAEGCPIGAALATSQKGAKS